MTPEELQKKLATFADEGIKLVGQINDENDAKKVKDYVATLAYYLGNMTGALERDKQDARRYRGLRKHMFRGEGKGYVWPDLRIIPWRSFTLDQMLDAIGKNEGENLSVYDRREYTES